MSFNGNIAANYTSQFYSAVVGIAFVPVYMGMMGPESYGLVAFFALLQAWLQVMDVGLSATISRESARFAAGRSELAYFRQLFRSMELLFWLVGITVAAVLAAFSPFIATEWIRIEGLPQQAVVLSLVAMSVAVALRWVGGLYRGVVIGFERQIWLGGFNILMTTLRFVGVVPVLLLADGSVTAFFLFQCAVSFLEILAIMFFSRTLVPVALVQHQEWSWMPLRSVLHFSLTVAFTSIVSVLLTQVDKLIISRLLTLEDFGYFSATVLMAGGITMVAAPIALALMPRLTLLSQRADDTALLVLYRQSSQLTVGMVVPVAIVMCIFAKEILFAWTGNEKFAMDYSGVLAMYAIGNTFLSLAAFPYYLQYAKGDLSVHLRGNILFALLLVPALAMAAGVFGAIGAGAVWAGANLLFFLAWTPYVHRRFLPGQHGVWLVRDIARMLLVPFMSIPILVLIPIEPAGRLLGGAIMVALMVTLVIVSLLRCDMAKSLLGRPSGSSASSFP